MQPGPDLLQLDDRCLASGRALKDRSGAGMAKPNFRELDEDELKMFNYWREEFSTFFADADKHRFETVDGKLGLIQHILDSGEATLERPDLLQGLGVLFGDALAMELNLEWAFVVDEMGEAPVLRRPGTSFNLGAFYAIEKRVSLEEVPIDIFDLFNAFCALSAPILRKRSLWARLFGPRLV